MAGLQCPACGTQNTEDAIVCVACREVIDAELAAAFDDETDSSLSTDPSRSAFGATPVPSDDDWAVSSHTKARLMGAVRPATLAESERADVMLRADAVLTLVEGTDTSALSPFEQHIASHLDGVRTVARVRKKTGLSGDDVRIALGLLRDKQQLHFVGLFDPSLPPPAVTVDLPPPSAPKPTAAPIPEAMDFDVPDVATLPGVDLSAMEGLHGPADDARTDPAVSRKVLDELRAALDDDDDDDDDDEPSPFGE